MQMFIFIYKKVVISIVFTSQIVMFSAAHDWNELQKALKLETHISLTNFKASAVRAAYRSLHHL
jgi:hypothetical protein